MSSDVTPQFSPGHSHQPWFSASVTYTRGIIAEGEDPWGPSWGWLPPPSALLEIKELHRVSVSLGSAAVVQFLKVHYLFNPYLIIVAVVESLDSLWPHVLQHARLPCPSPTSGVHTNSWSLSWWCHPAISSSLDPFSSCLQSFPASESFPMSWLFASDGQRIGPSASASVLSQNIQGLFPLGLTGLISLLSNGLSKSLLQLFYSSDTYWFLHTTHWEICFQLFSWREY